MFSTPLLLLLSLPLLALATPSPLTISISPVSSSPGAAAAAPLPLLHLTYDPATLNATLTSYTAPPSSLDSSALVRLGLFDTTSSTPSFRGILTTAAALGKDADAAAAPRTLVLHADARGAVFHIGLEGAAPPPPPASTPTGSPSGKGKKAGGAAKKKAAGAAAKDKGGDADDRAGWRVRVAQTPAGSQPALNKPVVLGADGRAQGAEEGDQRTFLQK